MTLEELRLALNDTEYGIRKLGATWHELKTKANDLRNQIQYIEQEQAKREAEKEKEAALEFKDGKFVWLYTAATDRGLDIPFRGTFYYTHWSDAIFFTHSNSRVSFYNGTLETIIKQLLKNDVKVYYTYKPETGLLKIYLWKPNPPQE